MNPVLVSFVAIIGLVGLSKREVPDFDITSKTNTYKDFVFHVAFEQEHLRHEQFEVYGIVIAIEHGNQRRLDREGHISVWSDRQFIYSSSLPQTTRDQLGLSLKKKVKTESGMMFYFRLNPRYIHDSWFNYQVLRDDGSVEMNCLVRLKDFIEPVRAEIKEGDKKKRGLASDDESKQ